MFKTICVMILSLMMVSQVVAKQVICEGTLTNGVTKDGFAKITIVCTDDVVINKDKPQVLYVKKTIFVFPQPD